MALVFELPLFVVGLTRIGILTTRTAAPEPADRLLRRLLHRRAASGRRPGHDLFETVPLLVLYEASIWAVGAARPPRRAQRATYPVGT